MPTKKPDVFGGQFYVKHRPGGRLEHIGPAVGDVPVDVWVCRRVVDFPQQRVPTGGALAICSRCAAAIVFDPTRELPPSTPKQCMQCWQIAPLPIEETP